MPAIKPYKRRRIWPAGQNVGQRFSARFLGDPPNAVFSAKLLGAGAASGARGVVWGGWAQGQHARHGGQ